MELLQTCLQTAVSSISADVKIISTDVRKLSEKMELFDKKGEEQEQGGKDQPENIRISSRRNRRLFYCFLKIISFFHSLYESVH